MARIRSVWPEQWRDPDFADCSPLARLLALGIRNFADDQGIFEWDPRMLQMSVLPLDKAPVVPLLAELVRYNIIKTFRVDGRIYGAIRNFQSFQKPRKPNRLYPCPKNIKPFLVKATSRKPLRKNATSTDQYGTDEPLEEDNDEAVTNSEPLNEPEYGTGVGKSVVMETETEGERRKSDDFLADIDEAELMEFGTSDPLPEIQKIWPHDRNRGRDRGAMNLVLLKQPDPEAAGVLILGKARAHVAGWAAENRKVQMVPALSVWLSEGRWNERVPGVNETVARPGPGRGATWRIGQYVRFGDWPGEWGPLPDAGVVAAGRLEYREHVLGFTNRSVSWDTATYGDDRPTDSEIDAARSGLALDL